MFYTVLLSPSCGKVTPDIIAMQVSKVRRGKRMNETMEARQFSNFVPPILKLSKIREISIETSGFRNIPTLLEISSIT